MRYSWRKETRLHKLIPLFLTIILVESLLLAYLFLTRPLHVPLVGIAELSTVGYASVAVDAYVEAERGVVVLSSDCWRLTAYTEPTQAESIALGLEKVVPFRPNAHDLAHDVFQLLGIEVLMAKVVDLRNGTYIGRLIVKQGTTILGLDARPSDATAIAVRANAPIYIREDLLHEYGEKVC